MQEKQEFHLFHFTSGEQKMDVALILNNYAKELDNVTSFFLQAYAIENVLNSCFS